MKSVMRGDDAEEMLACVGEQVGFWRHEPATGRLDWSDRLLAMLGETRERFRPDIAFFRERLHPEDAERVRREFLVDAEREDTRTIEYRLRHASGRWRTLRSVVYMRRRDRPNPVYFGVVRDVTREIEAARALEESRRSLDDIAASMPGAIFRYVLHPDDTDAIEYMSPGCEDIWELPAEALRGDTGRLWDMVPPEELEGLRESVERSAATLAFWRHRWRLRTPSGVEKWLFGQGVPARREDGGTLWHCIVLDVTEEMAMRDELARQRERLAEARKLEAVGRIAGGIAHDFNNLLAIVMGNAELLGLGGADERECRDEILRACRRGADLTQRLLSFARQSRLEPRRVDLNAAVREMRAMIERVLPATVALEIALAEGLRPVRADPAFLESAILNLVLNARDAMPAGGRLVVETAALEIDEPYAVGPGEPLAPGRYLMLAVTDTGVGIPSESLDRVTEPFFTTKGPQMGSGLGLAMVDGFVRQSGGALRLYSEPGAGTAVKLFLPAAAPTADEAEAGAEAEAGPAAPEAPARLSGRVLLVEDEAPVRRIAGRMLREAGLDVAEAADGDAALAMFETAGGAFDLLLTDVVMPGALDGPALADALRARRPGLAVIFMSGYPNEAASQGCGLDADDPFVMKPVRRSELLRLAAAALEARRRP